MGSWERGTAGRAQPAFLFSCYRCFIPRIKPGKGFPRIWRERLCAGPAAPRAVGSDGAGGGCGAHGAQAFGYVASFAPLDAFSGINLSLWKIAN